MGWRFTIQQDNNHKCPVKATLERFKNKNLTVLEWWIQNAAELKVQGVEPDMI